MDESVTTHVVLIKIHRLQFQIHLGGNILPKGSFIYRQTGRQADKQIDITKCPLDPPRFISIYLFNDAFY